MSDTRVPARGGRLQMPRSRGAASGFLLILLGAWGALLPFVGPYFDFAFPPDQEWTWTIARGWLEVLPGAATVVGGLLLLGSRNRATAMIGGWLTVLAGAWFVVGRALAGPLGIGDVGAPVAGTGWQGGGLGREAVGVRDGEKSEAPPLQRGRGGGHRERWHVVGGLDVVGADGGQVGEQAGETVHRGVVDSVFARGLGQCGVGALGRGDGIGAFGGRGGVVAVCRP